MKGLPAAATRIPMVVGCSLLMVACGSDRSGDMEKPAALTAATLGTQTVKPVADYLAESPYATASSDLGNRLLQQCRACHILEQDGGHTLGPNLFGVFGRPAGRAEGFGYTRALMAAEFVWTPRALDAWLAMPQQFLPGNAMAFGGLQYADDRAALIASLMRQTTEQKPEPGK